MFFDSGSGRAFRAAHCHLRRYARTPPFLDLRGATRMRQSPWVSLEFPLRSDFPGRTQSANSWRFPSSRLVQAWREGLFRAPGKPPRLPKWHRAFASPAAQTVPENLASAATAPLQRPVPLTLRRAGTSAAETPPSRAAGWDVATFLLLFCALTKGKRASQFASLGFSLTLPGSLNVSQLPGQLDVSKSPISTGAPHALFVSA